MENMINQFLDGNRENLKDFASSLIFSSWASAAIGQGMEIEKVFYHVLKFNIKGE